ncbi:MAG TPA: exodeoxyribonuclease V subunit gamma, partial [Thermodesulfobacteriota bacterium]|nr:exodeoxyribonuclease V subunit gamma [Thermodesulfobacteriota bacterium]
MPGLFLYKSNRLETLAEELAGVLRKPLASPFKQEIILVQSKGMERWVTMELARLQGICANCRFPFPNHFVYGLFRDILPDVPESSPFEPSTLTWKVMDVLPSKLKGKAFAPLKNYLCEDPAGLKLYQVSQRIADLFDQYLLFRPEMVLRWEAGKEDDWQAALWREVAKGGEGKHRAALRQAFMRELPKSGEKLSRLPERISVFGISALPGFHLEILEAVSASIEVNLFLMNPCREYWGDLLTRREERRVKEKARKYAGGGDLHIEKGNSLLASTGMLGRDFFDLISEWPVREKENFVDPGDGSLLCCLQSDILNLREKKPGERRILRDDDDSIRVHSCHSAMREVEVLQDSLLSWFEADGSLLPKDVLVMTPDIAAYSPFIQAVFSLPPGDPRSIPFSIADRGVRQESEAAEVFLSLLEFQGSRYGVSQVLSVLESGPVQKKFSISGEDLDRIRLWVRETRVRWGVDDRSRAELGLPPFGENTWRAALDRMLLGYAMPGRGEKMIRGILPYDAIEGSEAAALGRLAAVCDALFSLGKELSAERTLGEWGEFLAGVVDRFLLSDEDTERDILFIRRALRDLGEKESASGFAKKIPLAVIKAHLRLSLETEGFGSGFLTGGVTFCAMLPMRSIPFRAICLLGMNDDAYPRQEKALGFDRMARRPMPGDRSRRNDDRYLFLESLLSAREKIHISYTGQSAEDNTPRPPSVLVSELLDSIEEGFASDAGEIRDRIVTKHRLQAFSPEYFGKNARLFSYSAENLEAARQLLSPPEERKPFLSRLSEPGPEARN